MGRRHLRGGRDLDLVVEAAAKVDGAEVTVDDGMSDEPGRGLFLLLLLLLLLLLPLPLLLRPALPLLASLIGLVLLVVLMVVVCFDFAVALWLGSLEDTSLASAACRLRLNSDGLVLVFGF